MGRTDKLLGLKENVIIGKLIPSQALPTAEEVEAAVVQVEGGEPVALQQIDASAVPEDKQLSEPEPEAEVEPKSEDNSV